MTGLGEVGRGLTTVTVKVQNPEVTHIVKIQDFENWLNRGCKSPAETVLKTRLRQMLGMGKQQLRRFNAVGRRLAPRAERSGSANCHGEWIAARTDRCLNAQCHLRTERRRPAREFLSRIVPEHLCQPGMGAQAREGPYRIAPGIAPCELAMEGAGLRKQFGRAADEYLFL